MKTENHRVLIELIVLLTALIGPAKAANWIVEEEEICTIGGSNVFEMVSIGANATIGLTGDTVIIVTGGDEPGPAFYMGTGSTICASLEVPWNEAEDGGAGPDGINGEWGSFSNFVVHPFNPPTYYPPSFIDATDGLAGTNATAATPYERLPNLWIRVEGDVLLDYESEISLSQFDLSSHMAVNGGDGGRGGDGGAGGGYEEFRTSGDTSQPNYAYGAFTVDAGDGGAGGAAGTAANGAQGPAGGELRFYARGNIHLAGWVSLSANGFDGGDGGNAGNGGFPGTPAPGDRDIGPDGDYKDFGANGSAGNGAQGGAGGLVDIYTAGSFSAAAPANWVSAYGGSGGSGGKGSDCRFKYYGHATLHVPPPEMTEPGEAADGSDGGTVRIRAARFIGEAAGSGSGSGECHLWCGTSGGRGGRGGDLGINWGTSDNGFGSINFPSNGGDGKNGGRAGNVLLESQSGIYCTTLLGTVNGGNGGDGGYGGSVGGPGRDLFYVSGGNGGNGGDGGQITFRTPRIENTTNVLFWTVGGEYGDGGIGTYGEGPSGTIGVEGSSGNVVTQYIFHAFPMTVDIQSVPNDLATAATGDTVVYHCTFSNDSALAIADCVLHSDPLPALCEPVQGSSGSTGFWNAGKNRFETIPQFIATGQTIELDFSVKIIGPTTSGASLVNGAQATGLFNGGIELDYDLHSLPLTEGLVLQIETPQNGSGYLDTEIIHFEGTVSSSVIELVWWSSLEGELGTNSSVSASLSSGVHRIALQAVTASGTTNQCEVEIEVLDDGDNDGLPDLWSASYWPQGNSGGALEDWDHDGFSNMDEWIAGTNPTNPASLLFLSEIQPGPSGNVLGWNGVSNNSYRLLWSQDLTQLFMPLLPLIPGTNGPLNFEDQAHPADSQGFYKLQIVR